MWPFLQSLVESSTLSPHGICLLWRPELIWLNVISDAIIAVSYFSIPFALAIFVSKRTDVEFGWVFWAFAIFITACGMTHVMSIWTLWVPDYGIEGLVKAVTAAASIITAIMLWPLLPKVLALPSPSQLRKAQQDLETQTAHRFEAEERLRQSQKLEAVGQLTGGVAHDFNNLLTVIIGNLEIAQQNLSSWSKEAEEYVRRAIANAMGGAQRATALTQRLLAFARRQPLAPTPINVNGLVLGLSLTAEVPEGFLSLRAPASRRDIRLAFACMAGYAVVVLAVFPWATLHGPSIPQSVAVFTTGIIVAEFATACLLLTLTGDKPDWLVLFVTCAYLFSALMGVAHVLTFPGAILPDRPLLVDRI
jgi:signal transduction histidine kinase